MVYVTTNFSIAMELKGTHIYGSMMVKPEYLTTRSLPNTLRLLQKTFPSVLKTKCYNPSHQPFSKEVVNTEMGHLFEHILIEYICLTSLEMGFHKSTCRGNTSWNWKRDPRGLYHITAFSKQLNDEVFEKSFLKSIKVFENLFVYEDSLVKV